jgi:LPS-assembly protein
MRLAGLAARSVGRPRGSPPRWLRPWWLRPWRFGVVIAVLALVLLPGGARAQLSSLSRGGAGAQQEPASRDQPVTFTADSVEYDREAGIVTATGHVEAWQNDHVLHADRVTFDRNTNVVAASGHVVLVEPDGQTIFSDYAELTQGMRDAVLRGMRGLLAENGKLVANGGRRTEGQINEASRGVYTTCDLCKGHPDDSPLWQIRARTITQDLQNHRIEYNDAFLDLYGVPVFYFPYFSHADPSVRRASGFLVPYAGQLSSEVGYAIGVPYYYVIDDTSDATITPLLGTKAQQLGVEYRKRFNEGTLTVDGAIASDENKPEGYVNAVGRFQYNDTWRYGFNLFPASSANYLRDFRIPGQNDILTDSVYAEGFGVGAYARVDIRGYQTLNNSINQSTLPFVLPRYEYSFFGEPDALGGRTSVDFNTWNVVRQLGTNDQRVGTSLNWDRPFAGNLGEIYKLTFHTDAAAYNANALNDQPNYSTLDNSDYARAEPTAALMVKWPFVRNGSFAGEQLIEPIVQLIGAPNTGSGANDKIPNEDSLDLEFTDANLFALNKFPGIDRLEGGMRANVGLHSAWYVGGATLDGLVGQSYREHKDSTFPAGSGLTGNVSDIVSRLSFAPSSFFDITSRFRFDKSNMDVRYAEGIASIGRPILRISGGYLYTPNDPYNIYQQPAPTQGQYYYLPRNEISLNASSKISDRWSVSGFDRTDLELGKPVAAGATARYEDECLIFDANFFRRYTDLNGDHGSTTLLFQVTFKTVGQVGYGAF